MPFHDALGRRSINLRRLGGRLSSPTTRHHIKHHPGLTPDACSFQQGVVGPAEARMGEGSLRHSHHGSCSPAGPLGQTVSAGIYVVVRFKLGLRPSLPLRPALEVPTPPAALELQAAASPSLGDGHVALASLVPSPLRGPGPAHISVSPGVAFFPCVRLPKHHPSASKEGAFLRAHPDFPQLPWTTSGVLLEPASRSDIRFLQAIPPAYLMSLNPDLMRSPGLALIVATPATDRLNPPTRPALETAF